MSQKRQPGSQPPPSTTITRKQAHVWGARAGDAAATTFSGTVDTSEMARPMVSARPTRPTLQVGGKWGPGREWWVGGGG